MERGALRVPSEEMEAKLLRSCAKSVEEAGCTTGGLDSGINARASPSSAVDSATGNKILIVAGRFRVEMIGTVRLHDG